MGAPPPPPPGVEPSAPRAEDALPLVQTVLSSTRVCDRASNARAYVDLAERAEHNRKARAALDARILASVRARGEAYAVEVMHDVHDAYSTVASRLRQLEKAGKLIARKVNARDVKRAPGEHGSGQGRRYFRIAGKP